MYVFMHLFMQAARQPGSIYVCMYVCMYVCIHVHAHTSTCVQLRGSEIHICPCQSFVVGLVLHQVLLGPFVEL